MKPNTRVALLLSLIPYAGIVNASGSCNDSVTVNVPKATISMGASRTVTNFADAIACAALVAKQRTAIKEIDLVIDAGHYRQVDVVHYPKELMAWSGRLNIIGNGNVILSGAELIEYISKISDAKYTASISSEYYNAVVTHWSRGFNEAKVVAPPKLIVSGKPMRLAREPNDGFFFIAQAPDRNGAIFTHGGELISGYHGQANVFAHGLFGTDWADFVVPISAYNSELKSIKLKYSPKYGLLSGGRYFLEGAAEFVNSDKEYAASGSNNNVVFYTSKIPSEVEVTGAKGILDGSGVKNLTIKNIIFESVRGTAISLAGNNIAFKGVTVRNTGMNGVNLTGYNNSISDSSIYDIGATAIDISGGDRKTLAPSNSLVKNNSIHGYGLDVLTGVQGIKMSGVGIKLVDNKIYDSPNGGILFYGNDHLIKGNEIYDVQKITGDSGAIYVGRDWTAQGTVISENFIHHVYGSRGHKASAIYLDDQASGITITDNIIANVNKGFLIGGGRRNIVMRNVVVNSPTCLVFDDRGLNWQKYTVQPGGVMLVGLRYVPYKSKAYTSRYPGIGLLPDDRPGVPADNIVKDNVGTCNWNVAPSLVTEGGSVVENNITNGSRWLSNPSAATDSSYNMTRADYIVDWSLLSH